MSVASASYRCFAVGLLLLIGAFPAEADVVMLVRTGSIWRVLDNGSDQGTAWRQPGFNDIAWRSGRAQFGYGDGDEVTLVGYGSDANNKFITTYFRGTFVISNAPQFTNLVGRLLRDDGAVVYLNGTEVARQNMPAGVITSATRASISIPPGDEITLFPFNLNPRLLINGTNVLAVEVHQNGPQTSDMSFDLELTGYFTTNQVPPLVIVSQPVPGEYFYATSNITLRAEATAAVGTIAQVEFFAGPNLLGSASNRPFEISWNNALPGAQTLWAQATDSFGLVGASTPVTIYVLSNNAPWPVVIPSGAVWKYLATGTDPGTAWRTVDFEDSGWAGGPAQLGYGDGDEATLVGYGPDPNNKFITTYFRRSFTLSDPRGYTNLFLRLLRDDGAIVYLNGVEVFRSNMGSGPPTAQTRALAAVPSADETSNYYVRRVDPGRLRVGANVVAVEVHQNAPDSSDMSFDLELSGNIPGPDTSLYLSAGQRGVIRCVDHPEVGFDLYLPTGYSSSGSALPLLYTFHANGGGMVSDFQSAAESLQIILVGVMEAQNGVGWRDYVDVVHAVTRDVRQRINYDPTAAYAGGWSGGSVAAFEFSKYCRQELAGVFSLSGWLEFQTNSVDRYLTNLLVARANGDTDTAANYYLTNDALHLWRYGVVIRDSIFPGGHVIAPNAVKMDCLNWLLSQRIPAGPNDRADSESLGASWRTRILNGEQEAVLRECVATLMTRPRTYQTRQALLVFDELARDFERFRTLNLTDLATGDFALDHFYFSAFGAAKAGDLADYYSRLRATTGVAAISADRANDFRQLLESFGLPNPRVDQAARLAPDRLQLTFAQDAIGVDYRVEETADLNSPTWTLTGVVEGPHADGKMSAVLPATEPERFLRLQATIR